MRVKKVGAGPASALMLMASVLLVVMAGPAAASTGVERMEKAGWTCIDFGPLGIHCFNAPSAALFAGAGPTTVQARVFTVDQDGHETYHGTELLIRVDVFERNPNGERPCPQEGGHWHDLRPDFGLPYYGCHHFDMSG
jgi:hypothetical protein